MPKAITRRLNELASAARRHPEFIGCAVVAVLILLALVDTDWKSYARRPHEITDRVAEARSVLAESVWSQTERGRFLESADVAEFFNQRLPADVSARFGSDLVFTSPPGRPLKLEEPELARVQHLVADRGRVLIELRPPLAESPVAPAEVESVGVEDWPDELRRRRSAGNRLELSTAIPDYDDYGEDTMVYPDDEFSGTMSAARSGRGYPFVAVRGLFDVSDQVSAFADAVHLKRSSAEKLLVLIDFYLERQKFERQRDAWSSWQPVNVQTFRDVALTANGFEPDVVSSAATDPVITSPLLMRITGRWLTLATHPLLQDGQLSSAESQREAAFHQAILTLQSEERRPSIASRTRQRGFTDLLRDGRRLEEAMFDSVLTVPTVQPPARFGLPSSYNTGQSAAAVENLVNRIAERMDPDRKDRELLDWIRNRMTREASQRLLFRYFDFDVEPGATYRYQVRLELRNPNFRRPLAAATASHVVEGETRLTPWSEPTTPVTVQKSVTYFLAGLDVKRHRQLPAARLKVFQYDANLGTIVHQELPVEPGQQIGGTARAVLLNPAAGVQKEENYDFRSRDTLLDVLPDLSFDRDLHADLQLPVSSTGLAHIPEFALVLADGELRTLDPRSQAEELARQELYVKLQREQLAHLQSEADRLDGWEDEDEQAMYEELFGTPGAREERSSPRRPRNSLQRR